MSEYELSRANTTMGSALIVDDVNINIFITKEMLLVYGMRVDSVTSGIEAIEKIKEGNGYDIIFMDHMMPEMDGIETVRNIRELGYKGYIVALSASTPEESMQMFLNNGFDRYASKPIDTEELDKIVQECIYSKDLENSFQDTTQSDTVSSDATETFDVTEESSKAFASGLTEMEEWFIIDAKNAVEKIEELFSEPHDLNAEELESYETYVHGMKSALQNIGEYELSGFAYELESAAVSGDKFIITDETPAFLGNLKELIDNLSKR